MGTSDFVSHNFYTAVKWPNGDVEGFMGTGFGEKGSRRDALARIQNKADLLGIKSGLKLLDSFKGLTASEKSLIKIHWAAATHPSARRSGY